MNELMNGKGAGKSYGQGHSTGGNGSNADVKIIAVL